MSEVNNPETELTEENATINIPKNFMDAVFDDNANKPVSDIEETEAELEQSDAPDELEDEVVEDTDVEDDGTEDDSDDETEDDLDDDSEEETEEEVLSIEDLDTNQVIRLADGTETTIEGLVDGTMMQKDYTKKTQALADERKEFEETKAIMAERSGRMKNEHETILDAWKEEKIVAENQLISNPGNPEAQQRYNQAQVSVGAAQRQFDESESVYNGLKREGDMVRIQEANAYANEHIEGWTDDYATDLLDYAMKVTGATNVEILPFITGETLALIDKARKFDKGSEVVAKKRTSAKKKTKSLKKAASKSKQMSKSSKKDKADQASLDRYAETGDFADLNEIFPDNFMDSI